MGVLKVLQDLNGSRYQVFLVVATLIILLNVSYLYVIEAQPDKSFPSISSNLRPQTDMTSEKYINVLDNPEVKASKTDVIKKAIAQIKAENEDRIIKVLEKEVRSKNEASILTKVKLTLKRQMIRKMFRQDVMSGRLMDDMKQKYLSDNEHLMKSFITKDLIQGLKQKEEFKKFDDPALKQLAKLLEEQLADRAKNTVFFQYILEELIGAHDPKVKIELHQISENIIPTYINNPDAKNSITLKDLSRLKLKDQQIESLQQSHDRLVRLLTTLEVPKESVFSGDGIVINTGDIGIGSVLVLVSQLRNTGSVLPIEVVMNTWKSADKKICDEILPQFNAKCIFIDRAIPKMSKSLPQKLEKFQYKVIGLFISSFERAIVLDSDNLPIDNVDTLLYCQEFLKTGFLLWPDIWFKSTSPEYYNIARFEVGEPVRRDGLSNNKGFAQYVSSGKKHSNVAFHDLDGLPSAGTAETGQLVVNKRKHIRSLILTLYYNIYGPNCYYTLFYQGGAGIGDKDTFVPALHVFNEPYSMVDKSTDLLGFKSGVNMDGEFVDTTLIQYAPTSAKYHLIEWKKWLKTKDLDTRLSPFQDNDYTRNLYKQFMTHCKKLIEVEEELDDSSIKLKPLFLHIHRPKINPLENYNSLGIRDKRILGKKEEYVPKLGEDSDWELHFHSLSKWIACDLLKDSQIFATFELDQAAVCDGISKHVDYLKATSWFHPSEFVGDVVTLNSPQDDQTLPAKVETEDEDV
ncbi:hypothetical protein PSN45_004387 [Yamadazyma tenuis]|uniref:Nucleotide-diphospho-sugar transferase n=1 Tax=Candida tenuis (strain ATCC 10573 / BCRC 21748 / CBS 615 / JCM 9827 / NBRC 10315 / NRRL Y-1498 / VKM Y-70) TaxID=590646 RepID=G3B5Z0_CANTC|nr:uncharacterized protein CANTEDRAFT_135164 [Yamadazyma tenuis ATCC 10573]EGV63336.1 hypothetical protein CANTEDRAFT_135164 [Yamadazyma tenuis ATCC 10573]WEJ96843.1 hypothetical protein PSN45_004387 [Yamadazyma tenuis]